MGDWSSHNVTNVIYVHPFLLNCVMEYVAAASNACLHSFFVSGRTGYFFPVSFTTERLFSFIVWGRSKKAEKHSWRHVSHATAETKRKAGKYVFPET